MILSILHGAGAQYIQVTSTDLGVTAYRKWWRQHLAGMPTFGTDEKLSVEMPLKTAVEQTVWHKDHVALRLLLQMAHSCTQS